MEIPDEMRHYIFLIFIYSDKRRASRNKLFSFMWMSLYCASEDFSLSMQINLVCSMKRNKKKKYWRVKPPLCLSVHLHSLALKTTLMFEDHKCCARSAPATSPRNAGTLSPGRERARGTAQVLERLLQHRQHFLNFSTNGLQERLYDLQPILWNASHFNASQLKWKLCFVIPN